MRFPTIFLETYDEPRPVNDKLALTTMSFTCSILIVLPTEYCSKSIENAPNFTLLQVKVSVIFLTSLHVKSNTKLLSKVTRYFCVT